MQWKKIVTASPLAVSEPTVLPRLTLVRADLVAIVQSATEHRHFTTDIND